MAGAAQGKVLAASALASVLCRGPFPVGLALATVEDKQVGEIEKMLAEIQPCPRAVASCLTSAGRAIRRPAHRGRASKRPGTSTSSAVEPAGRRGCLLANRSATSRRSSRPPTTEKEVPATLPDSRKRASGEPGAVQESTGERPWQGPRESPPPSEDSSPLTATDRLSLPRLRSYTCWPARPRAVKSNALARRRRAGRRPHAR
jgi:hypothetical protein